MSTTESNPAGTRRAPRRRERVATVSLLVGVGAALAAVTLSGCGIRSTAVPVDAGLPASRTACPSTPEPSGTPAAVGNGAGGVPSAAATFALPGVPSPVPSETPWEALTSALPELVAPGTAGSGAASGAGTAGAPGTTGASAGASAGGTQSARAEHRSAAPSPHATRSPSAARTPAPARSSASGFSVQSCSSASASAGAP